MLQRGQRVVVGCTLVYSLGSVRISDIFEKELVERDGAVNRWRRTLLPFQAFLHTNRIIRRYLEFGGDIVSITFQHFEWSSFSIASDRGSGREK